jgi:2-dehydropantoate 2-reductase
LTLTNYSANLSTKDERVKKIEQALIVGAGAVGLCVADSFYRYKSDCISILAGGERLKRYREEGLWVNGERKDWTLVSQADRPGTGLEPDLIIIACKGHHLNQALEDMKPFVGPETILLSLINGISSEEIIGKVYGAGRLPLAMSVGTDAQRQSLPGLGSRVRFALRGMVHFGDAAGAAASPAARARDEALVEFFTRAGLPFVYHPEDMRRTLWYKFMINSGINQCSALLRFPYGPFKRNSPGGIPEAQALMESAMQEIITLANYEGIPLKPEDINTWYESLEELDDKAYTSMAQDVLAERKTEAELFGGTARELGKKYGLALPVNETLYRALRSVECHYN